MLSFHGAASFTAGGKCMSRECIGTGSIGTISHLTSTFNATFRGALSAMMGGNVVNDPNASTWGPVVPSAAAWTESENILW
jgi:hypothetical protein